MELDPRRLRDGQAPPDPRQALERQVAVTALLSAVAIAANEADDLATGAASAIALVCAFLGWPVGHLHVCDASGQRLVSAGVWHLEDPVRFRRFREVTDAMSFPAGLGLPGRVLELGRPVWISDVYEDDNFPRAKAAQDLGVKAGLGVPVRMGADVAGVLEFFTESAMPPDAETLAVLDTLGTLLGRVAERERAQGRIDAAQHALEAAHAALQRDKQVIETQVESQRLLLGRLVEHAHMAIGYLDPSLHLLWGNREFKRLAGWQDDGTPMPPPPEADPDALQLAALLDEALRTGRPTYASGSRLALSPETRYVDSCFVPVPGADGAIAGLLCLGLDVTDRVTGEQVTRAHVRALERLKSEFLDAVSHELRTPLMGIVGYAELLHDGAGGSLGVEQVRLVEGIERGAERLRGLVDELLDFARVEAGKFGLLPEAQDLEALIEAAMAPYRDAAERAGLAFERAPLDRPLAVLADPARANQALRHLLDNAVKFTPQGGAVTVRACLDGGLARIEVADTGPGIAEEHLMRVFDKFYQVDGSTTRAKDGTGLGLAVAKAIVEAHGGRIGADSRVGSGSTFWLTLPVAGAAMGKIGPVAVE